MEIREKVEKVLEEKINPILQKHYGGVRITEISGESVKLKFIGSCVKCEEAAARFERTVKRILLSECPEIKNVIHDTQSGYDFENLAKKVYEKAAEVKRPETEEVPEIKRPQE
ncbi:MAG: NifU family protein [Clostridia bacterium]|nr:NifU family protein [Clostridia bacterium]